MTKRKKNPNLLFTCDQLYRRLIQGKINVQSKLIF